MRIKSTEDLKKLFDILDDGDIITVTNKGWNQLPVELWGGVSCVSTPKRTDFNTKWMISYGGKTVIIKISNALES